MNYINLTTQEVVTATTLKYTGLRVDDIDVVHQAGWTPVEEDKPEYDPETQKLVKGELTIVGTSATQHWNVVALTEEEVAQRTAEKEEREGASAYLSSANMLKYIDEQSVRPLRAILAAGAANQSVDPEDLEAISSLETQAMAERQKLRDIKEYFENKGQGELVEGEGDAVSQKMRGIAR